MGRSGITTFWATQTSINFNWSFIYQTANQQTIWNTAPFMPLCCIHACKTATWQSKDSSMGNGQMSALLSVPDGMLSLERFIIFTADTFAWNRLEHLVSCMFIFALKRTCIFLLEPKLLPTSDQYISKTRCTNIATMAAAR